MTQQIDYKNPDYTGIFERRMRRLAMLREQPELIPDLKVHYKMNPWDFITDWGMTFDPRNVERGLLSTMPFLIWKRQREYLEWLMGKWLAQERGLVEKSRDCGVTWLSIGFAVSMWLFHDGFVAGFGSRKEELVDKIGNDKAIFTRLRFFVDYLPKEFRPAGWVRRKHATKMSLVNPENGSQIIGEVGDDIGRGGRASMYFVDEAAFIARQQSVDNALSQTTNCQIDISTFKGNGNAFYKKWRRFFGTSRHFVFDWRQDPRKDQAWYEKQKEELEPVTVAQEIDRDPNASNTDAFLPAQWVASAIDAHIVLGFKPRGIRVTGFDPADTGDAKACVNRHGSVVTEAIEKKDGEITEALDWAFDTADTFRADVMKYDGDGLGASMKVKLQSLTVKRFEIEAYHGAGSVVHEGKSKKSKRKKHHTDDKAPVDTYMNFRAQSYSWVRERLENTHEAVTRAAKGHVVNFDPDEMISISSECDCLIELQAELSRPMRQWTPNGILKVESKADMKKREVDSPNLADALVMAFSVTKLPGKNTMTAPIVASTFVPDDAGMGY